jgi:hypothetical protein
MKKMIVKIFKRLMFVVFIILATILLFFIVLFVLDRTLLKPTPESVLKNTFKISLKNFDYVVETFEKQWCPNGDGHALVIYKFNKLTQENIDYLKGFGLKRLPIAEEDHMRMNFNEIPKEYFKTDVGYYIYSPSNANNDPLNSWDYKVFVVDTVKNVAVLYYQYM